MVEQASSLYKSIDSLSAHEFAVELNGTPASGIFGVSGLVSFALDGGAPPLTIIKMVQQDPNNPFNAWARESHSTDKPRRDVAILAMDEGVETRRWVYHNAYITQIAYADFDTSSSELVEERITIQAERIEEVWPS